MTRSFFQECLCGPSQLTDAVGCDPATSLGNYYGVPNAVVNNWTACESGWLGQPYQESMAELAGGPVQPARA